MAAAPESLLPNFPSLMTVEEYRHLPPRLDVIQELHWGELVVMSFPKRSHKKIQRRLLDLLQSRAGDRGIVDLETPYRAVSEYDIRSADVSFISKARYEDTGEDLYGSPEIVIEVLSPSNTQAEMRDKAALCLTTGAEEFWVVDAVSKRVTIYYKDAGIAIYRQDEKIPLALFGSELEVNAIFEPRKVDQ